MTLPAWLHEQALTPVAKTLKAVAFGESWAMKDPVRMPPCPFCGGPPVPIVSDYLKGGEVARKADYGNDGVHVDAYVFCHECGANGPTHSQTLHGDFDHDMAEAEAVRLWIERDSRHLRLYIGGEEEQLNMYPRADDPRAKA